MKPEQNTALLLIDFQKGFSAPVWGARNNPDAEANAARLLAAWRAAGAAVVHVRHLSRDAGSPLTGAGADWIEGLGPQDGEAVFEKQVNSAFIGTGLQDWLRVHDLDALVIAGLTTPHCVSTTCRMAANLGFQVTLAHDACAAFTSNADTSWHTGPPTFSAAQIHDMAIAHLHGEFLDAKPVSAILCDG
ncbi:cysteine hydrolase family protein [Roseinatronobacter alkalisoli]|uniref:Cysteine hydrolase family protein n=1 Tax=Roseinatronobacter alkalisoli TaxID=3028235 RepID=A0ABT5T8W9_9RHOB|nr:cysteine hydrolase family protein [Roseinatronobacter sp. HJB301]MDD7971557.1 cysteine hydrolase family protein [Roseinatronobacter sp. HJB301]